MSNAELATSYAALILADDGVDITVRSPQSASNTKTDLVQADKLNTIIKAAGVPDVEPIWATLFAKVRSCRYGIEHALTLFRHSKARM